MVEGLCSWSATTKEHNDKNDEISMQFKEMQEHIQELFLEARQHAKTGKKKRISTPG